MSLHNSDKQFHGKMIIRWHSMRSRVVYQHKSLVFNKGFFCDKVIHFFHWIELIKVFYSCNLFWKLADDFKKNIYFVRNTYWRCIRYGEKRGVPVFFYVFASFKILFGVLIPREILFRVFFVGKKVKSNSPWQWCVPFCFFFVFIVVMIVASAWEIVFLKYWKLTS